MIKLEYKKQEIKQGIKLHNIKPKPLFVYFSLALLPPAPIILLEILFNFPLKNTSLNLYSLTVPSGNKNGYPTESSSTI